jgi:hypothetical protein
MAQSMFLKNFRRDFGCRRSFALGPASTGSRRDPFRMERSKGLDR